MKLSDLRAAGAFVSDAPVRKEITWTAWSDSDGAPITHAFIVHVRRQSFGMINRVAEASKDGFAAAALIAESILLGEAADERMTIGDALSLEPNLAAALTTAVLEVNGIGGQPKKSMPPMSSGMS